jgi:hypothetical protein
MAATLIVTGWLGNSQGYNLPLRRRRENIFYFPLFFY